MLYILYGSDDFSRDERLAEIKAGLGPREMVETNTTVLEGPRLTFAELTAACSVVPFLSDRRLVIVEGLLSQFEWRSQRGPANPVLSKVEGPAQSKVESEWRPLKTYVSGSMPLTTVLVLLDGPLGRGNPVLQELAPLAQTAEFPLLRGERLHQWAQERAAKLGATLSPAAFRTLTNLVGSNLRLLHMELEKLAIYAGGAPIQEADVLKLVAGAREASVFNLVDAVIEGRPAQAARVAHQLQDQGERVPGLLVMLTRQVRLLLQAKELQAQGVGQEELAARLGVTNSFVLQKTTEQSKRYSREQLKGLYCKLLEVDKGIKTGKVEEWLALDMLAVEWRPVRR
jgi:DNA polymerase-3 subunit delta